ncbi:MAG: hypothetical protein Q4D55_02020 [Eubacteriales bacterium]|nr:hypothetical protein [Eubacteriales bacterium]
MQPKDFNPFYESYGGVGVYEEEALQEREAQLMRGYFPRMAREVQELVEKECSLMDYEGSRLYDEYPDRHMLRLCCRRIQEQLRPQGEAQAMGMDFLEDLVEALFFHEVSRRRCRRKRCRGWR